MSVGPLYVLFGEVSVQVLCPFFLWIVWGFLVLSFIISLKSLDINPLLDVSLANIFSYSVGCLFILLMVSFAVQKLFSLMQSDLFIFSFVSLAQGDLSEKRLL